MQSIYQIFKKKMTKNKSLESVSKSMVKKHQKNKLSIIFKWKKVNQIHTFQNLQKWRKTWHEIPMKTEKNKLANVDKTDEKNQ